MTLPTTSKKILYLLPAPSLNGGMTMITKMFYESGIFNDSNIRHFNTSFTFGDSKLFKSIEFFIQKIRFVYILLTFRPNVIFVMSSSYWGFYDKCFYCLIARIFGVKSLLNPVGGGFSDFYESNSFNRFMVPMAVKIPHSIVIGSNYWNEYFKKTFRGITIYEVSNPVNCKTFYSNCKTKSTTKIKVVTVSNIIKEKGIEELIEVIKEISYKSNNYHFVIMGEGDKSDWVKTQLEKEVKLGIVDIKGSVSEEDKIEQLSSADIYILLTHFEVIPISILEAMSASLPILSTNVGGIPDLVKNGENGYLFEKMTSKPVVDKLIELEKDKMRLRIMGEKSLEIVINGYDIYSVIKKHFAIMNKI